jgi:hypothetical protein
MALTSYLNLTKMQLQYPASAASKLFTDTDLTEFINLARSQLAGEGECISNLATLAVSAATAYAPYDFTSVTFGSPSTGIQGIFNVRQAWVQVGTGSVWLHPRSWEWFGLYALNSAAPIPALPVRWCQYGQGVTGTLYFDPIPLNNYTMNLDTICYPIALVDDTTAEAIPYPWTDVVPFYAAWYALCAAQKFDAADKMFERVQLYMSRARRMSNPDVVPQNYRQAPPDPTMAGHLGIKPQRGGQQ